MWPSEEKEKEKRVEVKALQKMEKKGNMVEGEE